MSHPGKKDGRIPENKRVLFISYYFPPSGGPGVQRVLKFVKYLPSFGWDPIVLTVSPEHASYPAMDPGLEREVPHATTVVRTRAWDPYSIYARMLGTSKDDAVGVGFIDQSAGHGREAFGKWLRGNLFIPDARVGWVPFARRAATRILREQVIHAIISTGPPHSTHLVGRAAAARAKIPWVADFRDPWTGIDFYSSLRMTNFSKRRDARMEARILGEATAVVAVTPGMVKAFNQQNQRAVRLIMNGFDPEDFESSDVQRPAFNIAYVGNMNASRNPKALWRFLSGARSAGTVGGLRVRLVGPIDRAVRKSVQEYGLENLVDIDPPVNHTEAVRIMCESGILLLVVNQVEGSEGIMTGKLFEYIGSGRPVLGIGPPDGDAAAALAASGAGAMFDWEDHAGVKRFLDRALDFQTSTVRTAGSLKPDRQPYSRLGQTEQLALLLNQLTEESEQ